MKTSGIYESWILTIKVFDHTGLGLEKGDATSYLKQDWNIISLKINVVIRKKSIRIYNKMTINIFKMGFNKICNISLDSQPR